MKPPMNQWDRRDVMRSLDERYRYAPTSREYGQIMADSRAKKADVLKAAREKAKKK